MNNTRKLLTLALGLAMAHSAWAGQDASSKQIPKEVSKEVTKDVQVADPLYQTSLGKNIEDNNIEDNMGIVGLTKDKDGYLIAPTAQSLTPAPGIAATSTTTPAPSATSQTPVAGAASEKGLEANDSPKSSCRYIASASHPDGKLSCPGVAITKDKKTGATVYSQAAMPEVTSDVK